MISGKVYIMLRLRLGLELVIRANITVKCNYIQRGVHWVRVFFRASQLAEYILELGL